MDINHSRLGIEQKRLFLKKCHLFRGLTDDQLDGVANLISEMPYPADKMVIKQGSKANLFFMIYSGQVQVSYYSKDIEKSLSSLVSGDFFGEEAIKGNSIRTASVTTLADSVFLVLSHQNLEQLFSQFPDLGTNFEIALESRILIRQRNFKWIQPNEVLYFVGQKHPFILVESLAGSVLGLVVPLLLFWFYFSYSSILLLVLALFFLLLDVCWGIWKWLDWGNDYYIVSNKRVIWLEKVIGIYDSRQEAPLNSIISVGVETNQIGRIFNYGDVIVRTFVGRVILHNIPHPNQVASLVEEHWVRTREISRREDAEAMRQAMRESLGLAPREQGQPAQQKQVVQSEYKPGLLQVLFSNIFKIRYEDNGIITYRKHWFVLIKTTFLPGSLLIILLGATLYQLFRLVIGKLSNAPSVSSIGDIIVALLVGVLIVFGWWFYQYLNWQNDIFQVTPEQIIDIDKTPLGSEEKRVAPLENILSTEYKRIGLSQVLLNYGNVYITVGGAQIVFNDVSDPPTVQQDIDQRRIAIISQMKAAETQAERERLADWFAAYHRDSESFTKEAGQGEIGDLSKGDEFDVQ
jgi:hypothetical protein